MNPVLFFLGRFLQLAGMAFTLDCALLFFHPSVGMRPLLRMFVLGIAFFVAGWLLVRDPRPGRDAP